MDKQKQIEEILCCKKCYKAEMGLCDKRKIPEGVVVLTREEYKRLESLANDKCKYDCPLIDYPDFEREKMMRDTTRKETAEKFARLVEFHSVSTRDENGREMFTISALGLKEILHEEFGIPYDEICKEISEGKV